jgi:hypothetical protein
LPSDGIRWSSALSARSKTTTGRKSLETLIPFAPRLLSISLCDGGRKSRRPLDGGRRSGDGERSSSAARLSSPPPSLWLSQDGGGAEAPPPACARGPAYSPVTVRKRRRRPAAARASTLRRRAALSLIFSVSVHPPPINPTASTASYRRVIRRRPPWPSCRCARAPNGERVAVKRLRRRRPLLRHEEALLCRRPEALAGNISLFPLFKSGFLFGGDLGLG